MAFAHLRVHTVYSTKDSIAQVPDVVRTAADDGQTALAIGDHGTLGGIWRQRAATRDTPIKPIPSLEAHRPTACSYWTSRLAEMLFPTTARTLAPDALPPPRRARHTP